METDCRHNLESYPSAKSGLYKIALWKSKEVIPVFCDMDTDGGGWTVFQNRFDGSIDFYRKFSEYENGFGAPGGLKYTQEIASQGATEIRLEMKKNNGEEGYETYKLLDGTDYTLSINESSARRSAGISERESFSMTVWSGIGYPFSTYDRDKDYDGSKNLAIERHGAWWYASGTEVNLNGRCSMQCIRYQYIFIEQEYYISSIDDWNSDGKFMKIQYC
ncbi:ficolin-3-like [Mercenaria mercenaria]|uniref:ficolin-3-like n=1 Tax=Mercenaria mercenaria TaxID=6596 RepID=UPI00234F8482|nr:ficolin-3-like [Mercenaria mercenaria]